MLLLPAKVLELGLAYVGVHREQQLGMSENFRNEVFGWHYGSSSLDIAEMWFDLQQGEHEGAYLTPKENTLKGFKMYMSAHFFLWAYPKNAGLMSTRFRHAVKNCKGAPFWRWIGKIAALLPKKIFWDESLGDPDKSAFVGSIDCTDVRVWEKRAHHTMNIDRSFFSEKFNHAGYKYELVMNLLQSKCMSVVGPEKAADHDMKLFRQEAKAKMLAMPGKMLIADSIYKPGQEEEYHDEEVGIFAIPSSTDPAELRRFKSRARSRHESFNGRLKFFKFLQDTYHGTNMEQHGVAFRAICVIIQYQMDNGSPIFEVN